MKDILVSKTTRKQSFQYKFTMCVSDAMKKENIDFNQFKFIYYKLPHEFLCDIKITKHEGVSGITYHQSYG